MTTNFHSCFIIDVKIDKSNKKIILSDSMRCHYFIDATQNEVVIQFKEWLTNIFLKGIPQTVTVFEYSIIGQDPYITKFYLNIPEDK